MNRLGGFVQQRRDDFLAANPDLTTDEQRLLGLMDSESGVVGKISEAPEPAAAVLPAQPAHGTPIEGVANQAGE